MTRYALSDDTWTQLQAVMKSKGCRQTDNGRNVMEAILWKLRTGGPWRDIPAEFCPWKTAFNRFNRWATTGLWDGFFLAYEEKLVRSGYSSMEVMSGLTSMRAELGEVKNELSGDLLEDSLQRYTLPPMRMEIRSILKSLGVKSTMQKPPIKLFRK